MQEIEEWKQLANCPGYKISSLGNLIGSRGVTLKMHLNRKGYPIIRIPHRGIAKALHRAVAEQFIDGDKSLQVNHKDGNKLNNKASNLEFISCKDNIRHAIKMGLRAADANLKRGMFDPVQLTVIRSCFDQGYKNTEIALYFKCDHSTISKIRTGAHYLI